MLSVSLITSTRSTKGIYHFQCNSHPVLVAHARIDDVECVTTHFPGFVSAVCGVAGSQKRITDIVPFLILGDIIHILCPYIVPQLCILRSQCHGFVSGISTVEIVYIKSPAAITAVLTDVYEFIELSLFSEVKSVEQKKLKKTKETLSAKP